MHYFFSTRPALTSISFQAGLFSTVLTAFVLYALYPSAFDRRVNIFWLISLVCSLSAALLATLVQQWARAYMRIFQQSRSPLKTEQIRLFSFEDARRLPSVVEFVPQLIYFSLILFLWGPADIILHIDKPVFIILVCICLYRMIAPIWNPRLPHWTLFSLFIWCLILILRRNLYNRIRIEAHPSREQSVMEQTERLKNRDVLAVQWLVNDINGNNEM
jgi:hypothetical protein